MKHSQAASPASHCTLPCQVPRPHHFTQRVPEQTTAVPVLHPQWPLRSRQKDMPQHLAGNSLKISNRNRILLSISQHHPEEWQAAWGVRAALTAIRSFMTTKADGDFAAAPPSSLSSSRLSRDSPLPSGAIGGIDSSPEQRADLARKSRAFTCSTCGMDHATCTLAKVPYTVTLSAEPASPALRAAAAAAAAAGGGGGGVAAPRTPTAPSPAAPASPNPAAMPVPPRSTPSPAATASPSSSAAAAAAAQPPTLQPPPALTPATTAATAPPPQLAPAMPRSSNARASTHPVPPNQINHGTAFPSASCNCTTPAGASVDLYFAAFSVSSSCSSPLTPLPLLPSHSPSPARCCPSSCSSQCGGWTLTLSCKN
jgi:hypothetical protein